MKKHKDRFQEEEDFLRGKKKQDPLEDLDIDIDDLDEELDIEELDNIENYENDDYN